MTLYLVGAGILAVAILFGFLQSYATTNTSSEVVYSSDEVCSQGFDGTTI